MPFPPWTGSFREASVTQRSTKALRHRDFYRRLDALLDRIDQTQGFESMLSSLLEEVTRSFADWIGLESARLYRDDGEGYVVLRSFGVKGSKILGFRIDRGYEVLRHIPPNRTVYFPPDDPRVDRQLEESLGVRHFAAFLIGETRDYIAAFGLSEDADVQEAMLILSTLRHAIETHLRQQELEGQMLEARSIQTSLFPESPPPFAGFDLAGKSIAADQVGGDIIDFLPITPDELGLVVGDASGHGLPAALQARDVITGLRMGVEKDLKITSIFTRLNRVIHRSGLTSRFVSLFFGELESDGSFVYVNAGHDPGLLLRAKGPKELLKSTGLVLGPIEDLQYRRGWVEMQPGDVLVLYTDGIIERQGLDEQYGFDRMEDFIRRKLAEGVELDRIPDALLDDVFAFGQEQAWADDATVMLIRRHRSGKKARRADRG